MVGTSTEFDAVLELCRHRHRRIVLAVLAAEKRSLTVNDLTTAIVEHDRHASPAEISDGESKRIRTSLFHVHLPKLEDLSLVDFDRERQLVDPTPRFDRLRPQLSTVIDADPDLETPVALWDRPDSSLNDVAP